MIGLMSLLHEFTINTIFIMNQSQQRYSNCENNNEKCLFLYLIFLIPFSYVNKIGGATLNSNYEIYAKKGSLLLS